MRVALVKLSPVKLALVRKLVVIEAPTKLEPEMSHALIEQNVVALVLTPLKSTFVMVAVAKFVAITAFEKFE